MPVCCASRRLITARPVKSNFSKPNSLVDFHTAPGRRRRARAACPQLDVHDGLQNLRHYFRESCAASGQWYKASSVVTFPSLARGPSVSRQFDFALVVALPSGDRTLSGTVGLVNKTSAPNSSRRRVPERHPYEATRGSESHGPRTQMSGLALAFSADGHASVVQCESINGAGHLVEHTCVYCAVHKSKCRSGVATAKSWPPRHRRDTA